MIVAFLKKITRWLLWKYEHNIPETRKMCAFSALNVKISAVLRVENYRNVGYVSKMEADTHADTTVAGNNCVAMNFTERSCGVQPCSDEYEAMPDVPAVTAATGFTSKNGMNYTLVFPEASHMPNLDHSLFNPNQLRHFGAVVQDNPYDAAPMCVKSADNTFTACLDSVGTDIFLKTWAPSDADLRMHPHVVLSSSAQWSSKLVRFPGTSHLEQEEIESRNVCGVQRMEECICDRRIGHEMKEDLIFSIDELRNRIISSI
jgi:hypothetical protein